MENIKKCSKKLKDYYLSSMFNILESLKNNIQIKQKLNESIVDMKDENEIIYYTKILSNNNSLIIDNSNLLLNNYFKIIKSYESTLKNIKNELLNIQKILLSSYDKQIKNIFTTKDSEEIEESKNNENIIYLNLIELDKKYSKLLKINWNLIDFKDYFRNPEKLKSNITTIYYELKEFK